MTKRYGIAVPIALLTAMMFVLFLVGRNVLAGTTQGNCSIDSMSTEFGFVVESPLGSAPADQLTADQLGFATAELKAFPGAYVAEQRHGTIFSTHIPSIDGQSGVLFRLDGMPDSPLGGPDTGAKKDVPTLCTVAIYDDSGAFLVRLRTLGD